MSDTFVKTKLYSHAGNTNTLLAPETTADAVQTYNELGVPSTVEAEIAALRKKITAAVDKGVHFKGALTQISGLPPKDYEAGWQYVVKDAGTYAGVVCEVGDLVLCVADYVSGSASNSDWSVLQANIIGAVTGPAEAVVGHVVVFANVNGKVVKDSGFTVAKSVPADAKFTDTTYTAATASTDGLLSSALFSKLAGIAEKAEVNQNAFAKVKVGTTTLTAAAKQDTLEIETGEGVTIAVSGKKVTIKERYIDSCTVNSLDDVPNNLRVGGLIILRG